MSIVFDTTQSQEDPQNIGIFPEPKVSEEEASSLAAVSFMAMSNLDPNIDEATLETNKTRILQEGGDAGIREELVAKSKRQQIQDSVNVETTDPLLKRVGSGAVLLDKINKFNKTGKYTPDMDVVEQNAAEAIINDGIAKDPVRSALLELSDKEGAFLDQYQNTLAVTLKMDNIARRLEASAAEQGIASTVGDVASYLIPFYVGFADASLDDGRSELFSSEVFNANFAKFSNMSYEDKVVFLDDLEKQLSSGGGVFGRNAINAMAQFEQRTSLADNEGAIQNLFDALDLVAVGGLFKGFARTIISGAKLGRNAEATSKATMQVLDRLEKGLPVAERDVHDAMGVILPDAISVEAIKSEPVSAKVMNEVLDNEAALGEARQGFTLPRISKPAEREAIDLETEQRIQRELNVKKFKQVDVRVLEDSEIRRMTVLFGHGKDNLSGYGSELTARKGAKAKGILPSDYEVEKIQGKFYIKVSRDGSEQNKINALTDELTADTWYSNLPFIKRFAGAKSLLNFDISALGEVARRKFQKSISALEKPISSINKLGKTDRADLLTALKYGHEQEKWYSATELQTVYQSLFNRAPTDKEIIAYYAHKQLSDFAFRIRNNEVFTQLARAGYQETTVAAMDGLSANGKIVASLPNPVRQRIGLVKTNGEVEVFGRGEVSPSRLEELKREIGDDTVVVKLVSPTELPDSSAKIEYILAPKKQVSTNNLRAQQLQYREGGSTLYKGKNFVKQTRFEEGVNGDKFRLNDRTHFPIESRSEALRVAEDYNEALRAYKLAKEDGSERAIAEATDIIQQRTRYASFDEFDDLVEAGKIETTPFEVVGDRGVIPSKGNHVIVRDDDFEKFSDDVKEILDTGRLWYSRRGDRLLHPKQGLAPIVDPFETMSRSVTTAAKTEAYATFKTRAVESWVSKYGQFLVEDDAVVSPIQRFMNSGFASGHSLTAKEIDKAETARLTIKRLLHTPTEDQKAAAHLQDRLVEFVDAKGARKLATSIGDTDFRPLELMREVSFKARLGMADPSQMIVQMSMTPGVVAAGGKQGVQALGVLPWIKLAHRSPALIEKLAPLVKLTSGMDTATFKALLVDIRKSGVGLIGNTQGQLDAYSKIGVAKIPVLNKVKNFTDHLSYFFNSAERANQYLGYTTAWLQNGGKALSSADEIARVSLKSEAFAGNMGNASNAWWQKGVLSVPTQFQAFPARMTEIMLGAVKGGTSGGLNQAESLRMIAALSLVYGTGAIPLATYTYKKLADASPDGTVSHDAHVAITSGILGAMLPETSFQRMQPFGSDTLVQELFKGEKTFVELMTGPAGDLIHDTLQPIMGALMLSQLFFAEPEAMKNLDPSLGDARIIAADFIKQLGSNISSVSRGLKSYYAFQYGKYLTKNGEVIQDVSSFQAAMLAIGMPPRNSVTAFEARYDIKQRDEALREIAKGNARLIREAFRAKDPQVKKDKLRLLAINMTIITDVDDRRAIQKMTLAQVNNLKDMSKEAFLSVYKVFGYDKARRLFNYKEDKDK